MHTKKPDLEGKDLEIYVLEECQYCPNFLGKPIYPMGFPTMPQHLTFNGQTVQQMFMMYCRKEKWNEEQTEFMKQYLVYYMNAPVWQSPQIDAAKLKMKKSLPFNQLIWILLSVGLDPF